ncbi:hypothetical protein EON65_47150 [archaeon]|nr:MAG: hypothetical protein EON65_47150 [archaeon]
MASKIVKPNGAKPDEFELSVATEFANLEVGFPHQQLTIRSIDRFTWFIDLCYFRPAHRR